jgi:glycogen operon protein
MTSVITGTSPATGQTVNASHPVVRDLILDALRYWVMEMHVDGFRFDLASVLGRDAQGRVLADAPLLERIAEDPILRDAKLIAEAWDAAGAFQVGCFSQRRWAEWNGHFRDDVRRFWRGDQGLRGRFASRICGSSDLYAGSGKGPECSVNFVTCHDGFTLNDLVSYSRKHNSANGEGNREGSDENFSANYGVEGPAVDPAVEAIRQRQIKNFLLTLAIVQRRPDAAGRRRVPENPAWQQQRLLSGQRNELGRLVTRRAACARHDAAVIGGLGCSGPRYGRCERNTLRGRLALLRHPRGYGSRPVTTEHVASPRAAPL